MQSTYANNNLSDLVQDLAFFLDIDDMDVSDISATSIINTVSSYPLAQDICKASESNKCRPLWADDFLASFNVVKTFFK
jgi:hypothetical protein